MNIKVYLTLWQTANVSESVTTNNRCSGRMRCQPLTSGCSQPQRGWPARHGQQLLFRRHTETSRVAGGRRRSAGSTALHPDSSTSGTLRTPDPDVVINNDPNDRWGNWQKPPSVNSSKPKAATVGHYEARPHPPIWTRSSRTDAVRVPPYLLRIPCPSFDRQKSPRLPSASPSSRVADDSRGKCHQTANFWLWQRRSRRWSGRGGKQVQWDRLWQRFIGGGPTPQQSVMHLIIILWFY